MSLFTNSPWLKTSVASFQYSRHLNRI